MTSFFRKGKKTCWKTLNSKSCFKEAKKNLGENGSVDKNLSNTLGDFLSAIYHDRGHVKDVDILRFNNFTEKQKRE